MMPVGTDKTKPNSSSTCSSNSIRPNYTKNHNSPSRNNRKTPVRNINNGNVTGSNNKNGYGSGGGSSSSCCCNCVSLSVRPLIIVVTVLFVTSTVHRFFTLHSDVIRTIRRHEVHTNDGATFALFSELLTSSSTTLLSGTVDNTEEEEVTVVDLIHGHFDGDDYDDDDDYDDNNNDDDENVQEEVDVVYNEDDEEVDEHEEIGQGDSDDDNKFDKEFTTSSTTENDYDGEDNFFRLMAFTVAKDLQVHEKLQQMASGEEKTIDTSDEFKMIPVDGSSNTSTASVVDQVSQSLSNDTGAGSSAALSKGNSGAMTTPDINVQRDTMFELNRFYRKCIAAALKKVTKEQRDLYENVSISSIDPNNLIPPWAMLYLKWHRIMRIMYPDTTIIIEKLTQLRNLKRLLAKPGILIKYCDRRCGGLHDRLGSFNELVYIAYRLKRILLFKWYNPMPLETFLLPSYVNFTVPNMYGNVYTAVQTNVANITHSSTGSSVSNIQQQKEQLQLQVQTINRFTLKYIKDGSINMDLVSVWYKNNGHLCKRRNQNLCKTVIDGKRYPNALVTAEKHPTVVRSQVLVHKYWGKPSVNMSQDLLSMSTSSTPSSSLSSFFGPLWNAFFQPSLSTKQMISSTMEKLRLRAGLYDAVHCRVRHPGRYVEADSMPTGTATGTSVDASGFVWNISDVTTQGAINAAIHALQCAETLIIKNATQIAPTTTSSVQAANNKNTNQHGNTDAVSAIYFFSDSEELVRYVTNDLHTNTNTTTTSTTTLKRILSAERKIVSRDVTNVPSVHLDLQKGIHSNNVDAYLAIFVDLYLAIDARCITYGVGNFAYLAAKISGTKCLLRHEDFTKAETSSPLGTAITGSSNSTVQQSPNSQANWYNQLSDGSEFCVL